MTLGLGAIELDYMPIYLNLPEGYELAFGVAFLGGILILSIGLLGWASVLRKQDRTRLGVRALLALLGFFVIGLLVGGTNLHGPIAFFFLPVIPVSITGLIILLMAAMTHEK